MVTNRYAASLLSAAILASAAAWAQVEATPAANLADLEGQSVTIELVSGVAYDAVEVVRITVHSKTGAPMRLIGVTDKGRRRTFKFDGIDRVTVGDEVVYEAGDAPKGERSKPMTRAQKAAAVAAKEHEAWLARIEARGVKPWSPLTADEHAQAIEAHKQRHEKVAALLPSLQLYETERFLFCSNIPPQQVHVFIASLDGMYEWMSHTYGVDPSESLWRGKASVFAFATEPQFIAFERQFMNNEPGGAMGLCHSDSKRNICIAIYQGDDADYFGTVLVHETSHGFIHCYKTPVRVPSWVNEGMAEVIAAKMVPTSGGVQRKEEKFLNAMRKSPQPKLGEAFFAVDQNIPFDRYGGATSMTRFLIQTDQAKYVRFINLLKEGVPWEEAMQTSYNAGKQQLVSAYGQWIGVPHLLP